MNSPLSQLAAVEANLIGAIDQASNALDQLGTSAVSAAMDRLKASASAAQARLDFTVANLTGTVASVVEAFAAATAGILGNLMLNTVPATVVPAPIAAAPPTDETAGQAQVLEPADDLAPTSSPDGPDHAPRDAREAVQAKPCLETAREPSADEIAAQAASQEHESVAVATAANASACRWCSATTADLCRCCRRASPALGSASRGRERSPTAARLPATAAQS